MRRKAPRTHIREMVGGCTVNGRPHLVGQVFLEVRMMKFRRDCKRRRGHKADILR